jgi:4-aminobutyrate aminotransferase-like enzyme
VKIPGPRSAELAKRLGALEERNVTFLSSDFPIFWESARGSTVIDADGNAYVDCTAGFGAANAGHSNPRVVDAVADQASRLMHGLGDVHPTEIRVQLLERLATILPAALAKTFLATSGSEAIETALKTAMLATGKSRFGAYRGGYHGLSFGALSVGGIERFRAPFEDAAPKPLLLDFPRAGAVSCDEAAIRAHDALVARDDIAAIVIEPIQGRGGCIVPPDGYLRELRSVCIELGILLIVDEIFTGFGRTGEWFAIQRDDVVPDILCIGKAMGSGVPISAVVGREAAMNAWPASTGEALHTSTFLGNPLGCAAALATIDEIERLQLPRRAARLGSKLHDRLDALRAHANVVDVRGRGLFWGVQLRDARVAFGVLKSALRQGVIVTQSGASGETIALSPPLVIDEAELERAIVALDRALGEHV